MKLYSKYSHVSTEEAKRISCHHVWLISLCVSVISYNEAAFDSVSVNEISHLNHKQYVLKMHMLTRGGQ